MTADDARPVWWRRLLAHRPHAGAQCPFIRAGHCPYHRTSVYLTDTLTWSDHD